MTLYVSNAFALSMLPQWRRCLDAEGNPPVESVLRVTPVQDPVAFLNAFSTEEIVSAVGHADTAALFSSVLKRYIPAQRVSIELYDEDVLLTGQYVGPRLPEGTTVLPEGTTIQWLAVRLWEHVSEVKTTDRFYADEVSRIALE